MPLYQATQSLDVIYKFNYDKYENATIGVKGANIHARLYAGKLGLLEKRREAKYKANISKCNFATASVTYLYTDTNTEEGYLGEDINVDKKYFFLKTPYPDRIISTGKFYNTDTSYRIKGVPGNKSIRCDDFNDLLAQKIGAFESISVDYDYPKKCITNRKALAKKINDANFHEAFHHSEQAIMHYMSSIEGIAFMVKQAIKIKAAYLYGVILDLYTERTLCANCNAGLLGMQNSYSEGFLKDFSRALTKNNIQPRTNNNLMLNTRVSTSKARNKGTLDDLKLANDSNTIHHYDPDIENKIFQCANKTLGTKKIINNRGYDFSSYTGDFFSSKNFKKTRLEKKIALSSINKKRSL